MKYIKFNFKYNLSPAGIGHHFSNLFTLILYAYKNNYIPIIPTFKLEALHNLGKFINTNFSEYLDYSNLIINDEKFKVILNDSEIDKKLIKILDLYKTKETKNGSLYKDPKLNMNTIPVEIKPFYLPETLSGWINENKLSNDKTIKIFLPFNKNIFKKYNSLELNLKEYTCVHIRSGDYLENDKKFGGKYDYISKISTSSIKNKIESISESKNVYIMTNLLNKIKKKPGMRFNDNIKKIYNSYDYKNELLELKNYFNCKFYNEYPFLEDIAKKDNYLLYCIELLIMFNAKKRISMFNNKNKNDYYDTFIIDKLSEKHIGYT